MPETLERVGGFALILLLPLVIVGGALVTLFAAGALFDALDHPREVRGRIEAAFRRPPRPSRLAGPGHYYQPYWSDRS
jgi:hypothetical protein